jgi:uncharacterized protein
MSTMAAANDHADPIERAVQTLHGVLPDQGPIGVFVHHNTLHALQHLPFAEAVERGAKLLGTRAWPTMTLLRDAWRRGRIEDRDVIEALGRCSDELEELPLSLNTRSLRMALMREDIDGTATTSADGDAGLSFRHRNSALFQRARAFTAASARPPQPFPRRHRDHYLMTGTDADDLVHPDLVRLSLSFLDRGQAQLRMPQRQRGFLQAAAAVLSSSSMSAEVRAAAAAVVQHQPSARSVVQSALATLGVENEQCHDWIVATVLALRGVAGMFSRFERHPDETDAPTTLMDFLAVRLLLEQDALRRTASRGGQPLLWSALRANTVVVAANLGIAEAVLVAELARVAGHDLKGVSAKDGEVLVAAAAAFPELARNRVLFLAYEAAYRRRVLSALVAKQRRVVVKNDQRPALQVVFCIDEREESVRRALEEQGGHIETFGAAGFFGMAIDYQGVDDQTVAAHCPVVVVPAHQVHESPVLTARKWHTVRARWLKVWHGIEKGIARGTRGLLGGAGASMFLGPLAGALVASRVMAPRASLQAWKRAQTSLLPAPATRLQSSRDSTVASDLASGKPMGFSTTEAADRVSSLLANIGMVQQARLVVVLGHGSTSLNNPHESAHDCGACGGRRGGANARLFAELANRSDVRAAVRERGIVISNDTWFIGGIHDTCDDHIELFDVEGVPLSHGPDLDATMISLDRARQDSARERCRRFLHAPQPISAKDALIHVQGRANHLAQPRPEYGHCTNAMAVVGRRQLSRGLHFDRRAFLVSYDPSIDGDDHAIVERVLAAVGPVGAGINLEYYFSSIDNEGYGCGTKLPHNVTGLLGVMNGHQGDLRTGLPLQMVELHEPMRLLLIVEASPAALLHVAGRQAEVRELVVNEWIQLVSVHPMTGAVMVFDRGAFVPFVADDAMLPEVNTSHDWHGKSREFVEPALVVAALS